MVEPVRLSGGLWKKMNDESGDLCMPLFFCHSSRTHRAVPETMGITRIYPAVYPDSERDHPTFQSERAERTQDLSTTIGF
jgi:hypothetical protein